MAKEKSPSDSIFRVFGAPGEDEGYTMEHVTADGKRFRHHDFLREQMLNAMVKDYLNGDVRRSRKQAAMVLRNGSEPQKQAAHMLLDALDDEACLAYMGACHSAHRKIAAQKLTGDLPGESLGSASGIDDEYDEARKVAAGDLMTMTPHEAILGMLTAQ